MMWSEVLQVIQTRGSTTKPKTLSVMSLMSSYGTNDQSNGKETQHDWKEGRTNMMKLFKYPEMVHNHFQYHHAVG